MAAAALRRFTGQGLRPVIRPQEAHFEAVRLIPGNYVAGQVMGQFSNWTAANDVQTITVTGTPTGGSFYLVFNGVPIGPILFNSTAAQLQAILDAASNIGSGQTVVSGGPLPGTALVVTFSGALMDAMWQPLMTLMSNGLTGGTTPTATVAHTTVGRSAGGQWAAYNDSASDGTEVARGLLARKTTVNTYGDHVTGGGAWNESSYTTPIYMGGFFRTVDLTGLDANGVADLGYTLFSIASLSDPGQIIRILR